MDELPLSPQQKRCFKNILDEYSSALNMKEDVIKWCGSKSGAYSVKIGYNIIENADLQPNLSSQLCWSYKCLRKVGVFTWLVLKRRILTRDRMLHLRFNGPFQCVMHKRHEESLDHLLLNCDFTQGVWRFMLSKLGWSVPLLDNITDFLKSWFVEKRKCVLSSIWTISPSTMV